MIDFLLRQVYNFVQFTINLLPDGQPFSQEFSDAFVTLGSYWNMFDAIIPMTALGTVVLLIFSVELAIYGIKFVKWLIKLIPTVG